MGSGFPYCRCWRLGLYFTAENAENAEGFIFKTKGQQLKTFTAESAEDTEALILKD